MYSSVFGETVGCTGCIFIPCCTALPSNARLEDVWFQLRRRHLVPATTDSMDAYILYPSFSKQPLWLGQTLNDIGFKDSTYLQVSCRLRGGAMRSTSMSGTELQAAHPDGACMHSAVLPSQTCNVRRFSLMP